MKRILLLFSFLSLSLCSYSQSISIYSSQVTNAQNGVNLDMWVFCVNGFNFLDFNYTINGNQIDVSICYYVTVLTMNDYHNVVEFIPLPNPPENYTMNVVVYNSSTDINCDYSTIEDTESFTLSNESFQFENENLLLYPNPTNGIINFESIYSELKSIKFYTILGQLVKESNSKKIDLTNLENGTYFALIETINGLYRQKIILKK